MTEPERIVERLKEEMMNLGPMLPGSISKQYNVCGKFGCRCKDPKRPLKHGPYHQLSFSIKGKSSTMFIRKGEAVEAQRRIRRYQQFKKLRMKLIRAYVDLARKNGLTRS